MITQKALYQILWNSGFKFMANPNCCFMIIAVTFFFSSQSSRGTVTCMTTYERFNLTSARCAFITYVRTRKMSKFLINQSILEILFKRFFLISSNFADYFSVCLHFRNWALTLSKAENSFARFGAHFSQPFKVSV